MIMARVHPAVITLILVAVLQAGLAGVVHAETVDLTARLEAIYQLRAQWLLTDTTPTPIEADYKLSASPAQWALQHEKGKIRYVKQWAENRGVRIVEAQPTITVQKLNGTSERVRFYVRQSMSIGYTYPGEPQVNRFGVGTRHIVDLRQQDGHWLIGSEWYTDPLGDDTEVPDVTPAMLPDFRPVQLAVKPVTAPPKKGYDREGAVAYSDDYCGLAWGCGNDRKYNPRFRDYNGVGGDCTNYISQALRIGGKLSVPIITRVDALAGHLRYSGRARVVAQEPFQKLWQRARNQSEGFKSLLQKADLIAYQEKGKLEHFAIVTDFDSHGYPLVNSHTADRFHVPFDLGWDRQTIYWLFQMRD
jgi:hypothetical protein